MSTQPNTSWIDPATLWMSRTRQEDDPASVAETEFRQVLARAVSGDSWAFEQIVVRHERRVLTLSWRLLGSMEDAQDAAQEVFLRTFKYLHRFDLQKPFEPWLVRLTVNVCRDLGRKRSERGLVFVESEEQLDRFDLASTSDPFAELQSEQQRRMLYRLLASLPEKERTAFVLRDIEGLSTAETAEALGSSEATVRSQISSARLKMRKAIAKSSGGRRQ